MHLQIASGKGVLGQLSLETGLSEGAIELILVAFIGYNAFSVRPVILYSCTPRSYRVFS